MSGTKHLKFTKMHGIGNDYVYIDTWEQTEPPIGWSELAKRVAERRFGVGSDGLILIEKPRSKGSHGSMRMFNADGSESEMCGNGLRCVAKYLHDRLYPGIDELDIDTGAGTLTASIAERDAGERATRVSVNMGTPILEAEKIPTIGKGGGELESLQVGGKKFDFTAVSMGNPHCVIFHQNVRELDLEIIGPMIENCRERFPKRVNVEFVEILSRTEVVQRTWERGAGITLACGTGASAVCVAASLRGHCESEILVHLDGGDLRLQWAGMGHPVIMTGGASHVFEGTLDGSWLNP